MNLIDAGLQHGDVRVLVTGANGFVGRAMCEKLAARGIPVVAFDVRFDDVLAGIEQVCGDVRHAAQVDETFARYAPTHVLHGGGISGIAVAPGQPRLIHEVNVLGTLNLLDAASHHAVRRFVQLSSIAAYGRHPGLNNVDENVPLLATDAYGASKAASERIALSYRQDAGLDVIALRVASLYGARRRVPCVIGKLFASAQGGPPARVSAAGRNPRQLLHIDDCLAAILPALFAPTLRRFAYNIATGRCVYESEVAAMAVALDPRVRYVIEDENLLYDNDLAPLDVTAAACDLGFIAQVDLQEGLALYWRTRQPA